MINLGYLEVSFFRLGIKNSVFSMFISNSIFLVASINFSNTLLSQQNYVVRVNENSNVRLSITFSKAMLNKTGDMASLYLNPKVT